MNLFKLSVRNIRRSLRDYTIYFFTLIIGVAVFYVFNTVGTQAAFLELEDDGREIANLLTNVLSGVSVFVAAVLGLLIVYAGRFLMKRRNKEFALYMTLGMSKGNISTILFGETVLIGIGSLAAGLVVGVGLSQLMSAVVVNLFEADMSAYRFMISGEAIVKTCLYFAVMYFVVMLFHSVVVRRFKLIDLMQSGKKSEQMKVKNPIAYILIFLCAAVALGYAYERVGWNFARLDQKKFMECVVIGVAATFLIFYSVSGLFLRIALSMKSRYYKGLNSFTFRQISSKVNTTVFSMTVICLMLFITICTLSLSFSIRNSMNDNLKKLCPADMLLKLGTNDSTKNLDVLKSAEKYNFDAASYLGDYVHFNTYQDSDFTFADFCGEQLESLKKEYATLLNYSDATQFTEEIISLSDYNALMELYGREKLDLRSDEFVLVCDYESIKGARNQVLANTEQITVFGHPLKPKETSCVDGFIQIGVQHINIGVFVVPDDVVAGQKAASDYLIGNYVSSQKEEKKKTEKALQAWYKKSRDKILKLYEDGGYITLDTKLDIASATVGLGAIVTFLGLYIGIVFLIACGALLALKELSESVDSMGHYEILRKIGAEEKEISESLFVQIGIFFLLPLLLAVIHSVFGIKFGSQFLDVFGMQRLAESIAASALLILLLYGGYFMITCHYSKKIIKGDRYLL